jgi:CheY-like chemotaxis protein
MPTENRATIRALVVDDHPDVAASLARLLEAMGCVASFVTEAGKAIEAAVRVNADLVFVDIVMPGIDGYQLARMLRERFGDAISLIALSAYRGESHYDVSREAGFDAGVQKPIGPNTLESILAWVAAHR